MSDNTRLLSEYEYNSVVRWAVEAFDILQTKGELFLDQKRSGKPLSFLITLVASESYTFFTLARMQEMADTIFTDADMRRFTMDLVDAVAAKLAVLPWDETNDVISDPKERLVSTVVHGLKMNRPAAKSLSLMNKELVDSIDTSSLETRVINQFLSDNFWAVILYILVQNFSQTAAYAATVKGNL